MANGKIFNVIKADQTAKKEGFKYVETRNITNNSYGQRLMEKINIGRDKGLENLVFPKYYGNCINENNFKKTIIINRSEDGEFVELFPNAIKAEIVAQNPLNIGNLPQVINDGFLLYSDIHVRENSTDMKDVSNINIETNVNKFNIVVVKFRCKSSLPTYLNPGFTVINDVVKGADYINGLAFDDAVGNSGLTVETFTVVPNVKNVFSIRHLYEGDESANYFIVARYTATPVYQDKDWIKLTINRIQGTQI